MADEITCSVSIAYDDGQTEDSLDIVAAVFTSAGKRVQRATMTVLITETAVPLGPLSSLGFFMAINRDPTNYVEAKVAASGAIFARLLPDTDSDKKGGFCAMRLGSGAQVPVMIANSASCKVDYLIVEA